MSGLPTRWWGSRSHLLHLLDDGLPEPDILGAIERREGGHTGATQATESDRDDDSTEAVEIGI